MEDLTLEDFQRSTELSSDLKLDVSTVDNITLKCDNTMTLVHFVVGDKRLEVCTKNNLRIFVSFPAIYFLYHLNSSHICTR